MVDRILVAKRAAFIPAATAPGNHAGGIQELPPGAVLGQGLIAPGLRDDQIPGLDRNPTGKTRSNCESPGRRAVLQDSSNLLDMACATN